MVWPLRRHRRGSNATRVARPTRAGGRKLPRNRLATRAAGLLRAAGGVSTLEFALTAPLMLALMMPVVDLGMGFYQQMEVSNAVEAGVAYALINSTTVLGNFSGSISNIEAAVTSATSLSTICAAGFGSGSGQCAPPSEQCGCPNASDTAIEFSSTTEPCSDPAPTCASTSQPSGTYVTVSAQASYTPLLPCSFLCASLPQPSASAIVRLQ
jgi:TadE-like protein